MSETHYDPWRQNYQSDLNDDKISESLRIFFLARYTVTLGGNAENGVVESISAGGHHFLCKNVPFWKAPHMSCTFWLVIQ